VSVYYTAVSRQVSSSQKTRDKGMMECLHAKYIAVQQQQQQQQQQQNERKNE
jgi:hypothetical protein